MRVKVMFRVTPGVKAPLLSYGKLRRDGVKMATAGAGDELVFREGRVPVFLVGNSLRAEVRTCSMVGALEDTVGQDKARIDIEERFAEATKEAKETCAVGGWSSIKQLQEECRRMGAPIYGDKQTLVDRVHWYMARLIRDRRSEERTLERQASQVDRLEPSIAKTLPVPEGPSELEREVHELTHYPRAPWCSICVKGSGMERPHRKIEPLHDSGHPLVEYDFGLLKTSGEKATKEEESVGEGQWFLAVSDRDTGMLMAIPVENKGQSEYMAAQVVSFLRGLFHRRVRLRSDNEPAVMKVGNEVKKVFPTVVCQKRDRRTVTDPLVAQSVQYERSPISSAS